MNQVLGFWLLAETYKSRNIYNIYKAVRLIQDRKISSEKG